MNLEDPVSLLSVFTGSAHSDWIVRMNIQRNFVARNSLVREMPDQVPRDRPAVFPPILRREFMRIAIQLVRLDVRMALEILLPVRKPALNVVAKLQLHRVVTQNECSTEVRLPLFEHGTKIQKQDVVRAERQVRRI